MLCCCSQVAGFTISQSLLSGYKAGLHQYAYICCCSPMHRRLPSDMTLWCAVCVAYCAGLFNLDAGMPVALASVSAVERFSLLSKCRVQVVNVYPTSARWRSQAYSAVVHSVHVPETGSKTDSRYLAGGVSPESELLTTQPMKENRTGARPLGGGWSAGKLPPHSTAKTTPCMSIKS